MFKKLLGIMLAVILAVSPVATFATDSAGDTTVVVTENFNDGVISDAWVTSDNGTAAFSSGDYGYLKFTANEANATLTRELGITEGAFTVDFKIKAESTSGTATVSVGGMELILDLTNKTLAGKGFISNLWYNVRVASDGSKADVYLDGAVVSENTDITFENAFEIIAAQSCVIGIDDFKVYAEKLDGNSGMIAEVLNMTFDGFNYEDGNADIENMKAHYNETAVNGGKAFNIDTEGNGMNVCATKGNFGKASNENSLEITHNATDGTKKPAGVVHFAFGEESKLYSDKDTQVLSFNVAMDDDEKRELVLRYYTWYYDNGYQRGNAAGVDHTTSTSVKRGKLTQNAGWLINLHNDRIYLFGQNEYYSIIPALMPEQWNNIRIEITPGDGTTNAFTYSAYINDIAIVEDKKITTDRFFVRNSANQEANRGAFYGIHRLAFEYQTSNAYSYGTAGGVWLDDIKLTNYYQCKAPEREASPLLVGDNVLPATNTSMSGDGFDAWEYDKWVTGPVVYVDKDMTLGEYRAHLTSINKNLGVTFRNTDGSDANDTDKIGDLKYAEIIKTNYEKMYVSLIGDDTGTLKEHSDDVSAIGSSSAVGTFYIGNATLSSITGEGARLDTDSSAIMSASGTSTPTIRYANHIRRKTIEDDVKDTATSTAATDFDLMNTSGYINTATLSKSASLRPVTFEVSVMMPEEFDGYVKIPARYYMALPDAQNDSLKSNMEKTFAIFEGGLITLENRISAISDKSKASIIGTYNPGEWTHLSVTVYPGAASNRVDVRVNGEYATIQNFDVDDETYATIKAEAAKSGTDLRDYPRVNTDAYSRALMLAASNVKLQTIEEFIVYYYGRTGNTAASSIGIDDLKASWGYYKADVPSITPANKGVIDILSADKFLAQSGKSVADIKSALTNNGEARVYTDATYANEQTGNVATGNKIVVQNGAILKYFTIDTSDFVKDGNAIKSLARSADDKLYVALYDDADATKISSVISATAEKPGIIGKEVPASIKAFKPFLWNSLLVPYVGAGEAYSTAE